jgi:hypothetical protein
VNGTRTYELSNGCTGATISNDLVQVMGSELLSAVSYDFEQPLQSFNACVVAKDGVNTSAPAIVAVTVVDVNEDPTDINISQTEWAEIVAANSAIATFSTVDVDAGSSFTYALVGGTGDDNNDRFAIVNNGLSVGATPLAADEYKIRVKSTDNGGLSVEKAFILKVYGTASLSFGAETSGHGGVARQNAGALTIPVLYNDNGNTPTSFKFKVTFDADCLAVTSSDPAPSSIGSGYVQYDNVSAMPTLSVSALASCPDSRVGNITPALKEVKTLGFENVEYVKGSLVLSLDVADTENVTVIDNSELGNCNADAAQGINAADYVATVLEIFDGDGNSWLAAPAAGFDGSPYGCDSNRDTEILANDIVCTVHESFGSECTAPSGYVAPASAAALNMAAASANAGAMVNVPLSFDAQGASIGALVFTLKLDPAKAAFDATDADGDGNPDALHFNLADGQSAMAIYDAAAGKIHVAVFSITESMQPISGDVVSVDLLSLAGGDAGLVIESASASTVDGASVPVSGAMGGQAFLPAQFFNYLPVLISQ